MTTPEYATAPAIPRRPGTVTAGIVIVSIGVVLGLVLLLFAFSLLGQLPPSAQLDASRNALFVSVAVIVGNAVGVVLVILGFGWARFLLIATGALGILTAIITGSGVSAGDALYVVAIVLLFLPKSNEYFAERAALRSAR